VLIAKRLSFILTLCCRKVPAAYPPAPGEQPWTAGILGLATHKWYNLHHHWRSGGLLPRLFTLTSRGRRLFSVTL